MSAELRAALEEMMVSRHFALFHDSRRVADCEERLCKQAWSALASTSIDGVSGTGLDVAWAEAEKAVAELGEQFRLYVRALATGYEAGMALPEIRRGSFVRSEHETPAIALADFTAHVRAALAKDGDS